MQIDFPYPQIRAFYFIVRYHGVKKASAATRIAASTLSKHLSDLEKLVGEPLCYDGRHFQLTPAGRRFACRLEEALRLLKASWDSLRAEFHPIEKFGAPEVVTRLCLPGTVEKLEREFPQLSCSTESATEGILERLLREDDVNFVIATEGPLWRKYRRTPLAQLPLGLICAAPSPIQPPNEVHRKAAALLRGLAAKLGIGIRRRRKSRFHR